MLAKNTVAFGRRRISGITGPHREAHLFDLLGAEKATGIMLTESFAMHPGASVSGLYFSHPDSNGFTSESARFGTTTRSRDTPTQWKNASVEHIEKWSRAETWRISGG